VTAHRLLFDDLLARLRWRFPVLVLWTALVGLSEGAAIVLLLPLLNRVGIVAAPSQSTVSRLLERALTFVGVDSAAKILVFVVAVATVQMVLSVALNWWSVQLARSYQSRRQLELFGAFMRAKWTFLVERKAGEMVTAIVTECERLGRAFTLSLSLFGSAVVAFIYVTLSAFIAWEVTLSLIGFALAAGLAMTQLYKKSFALGQSLAPLNSQLQSVLDEQIAAAKFIKASAGVDRAVTQIEPLVQKLGEVNAFASAMPGVVRGVLEYIALIGLALILVLASKVMGVAPANVVVVLALFGRLFPINYRLLQKLKRNGRSAPRAH
jgi:ATP-binding cassette subfamily C protein